MKIFIDVNVFIDVMTKRSGWTDSLRVLNLARRSQEIESWTSAFTLPLLYFFRRRVADETTARADAQAILKGLHLVELGQTILDRALASVGPDFEDNIQLASAESISATHLITRNKKDFDTAQIVVLHRRSGSSYKKSPHSKPISPVPDARQPYLNSFYPFRSGPDRDRYKLFCSFFLSSIQNQKSQIPSACEGTQFQNCRLPPHVSRLMIT